MNRRNSLSIRRLASIAIIAGAAAFLAPASAFAYQSLKVTKSVDRATAPIGDTLTYTIVVSDDGSKFPTNPGTITDTLPPQLTYVSGGPNCSVAGQVVTCAVPKIGAGEVASVTYTIKATINPGVAPGTVITNNVKLSVPFDETSNNNDASAMTTTVTQGLGNYVWIDANGNGLQDDACTIPGVTVTLKDASGKAIGTTKTDANCQYRFDNLQYDTTYQVCVDSPADYAPGGPLSGTTVTKKDQGTDDDKDSDADQVGPTNVCITAARTGQAGTFVPTYDIGFVRPTAPAPVTPAAPAPAAPAPATPSQPAAPEATKLAIAKSVTPTAVDAGGKVKYTVIVSNVGATVAIDMQVCDTLPLGITVPNRARGRLIGGQLCWTVAKLAVGAKVTYTFDATVDRNRKGKITNTVCAVASNAKKVCATASITVSKPSQAAPPGKSGVAGVTG